MAGARGDSTTRCHSTVHWPTGAELSRSATNDYDDHERNLGRGEATEIKRPEELIKDLMPWTLDSEKKLLILILARVVLTKTGSQIPSFHKSWPTEFES